MLRYSHHQTPLSKDPSQNKLIFIDRDGVINVDLIGDYIKSWEEFKFEAGALEALQSLTDRGYQIIIISNQAGIGDRIFPKSSLRDIHHRMIEEMEKNGIRIRSAHYCLHGKDEGCKCRKPEIGLLEDATKGIPFLKDKTYLVGDKATDIEAAKRYGLKTVFVRTGHGKFDEKKFTPLLQPDIRAENFLEAVKLLPR